MKCEKNQLETLKNNKFNKFKSVCLSIKDIEVIFELVCHN